MADRFNISLPEGEKNLANWIREQMKDNEFSPSLVFRDAMLERKKNWDISHSESPLILHKRIDTLRETIKNQSNFIESKGLTEEWLKFVLSKDTREIK